MSKIRFIVIIYGLSFSVKGDVTTGLRTVGGCQLELRHFWLIGNRTNKHLHPYKHSCVVSTQHIMPIMAWLKSTRQPLEQEQPQQAVLQ